MEEEKNTKTLESSKVTPLKSLQHKLLMISTDLPHCHKHNLRAGGTILGFRMLQVFHNMDRVAFWQ
jgi:hypothetical protein